jgi:hypothetical protein
MAGEITRKDSVLRIQTGDPSGAAVAAISRLGADVARVRDLQIIQPSLDSLYISLTEERYSPGDQAPAGPEYGAAATPSAVAGWPAPPASGAGRVRARP